MLPKMIHLSVSTNNVKFPYHVRYPATMALVEFKIKLELVVGVYSADMKLELRSPEGKFLAELVGDDRTLEELGVRDQSIVYVHDSSEATQHPTLLNSGEAQTRYVMPEDKYAGRKDTVRKWKQELLANKCSASPLIRESEQGEIGDLQVGKKCLVQTRGQPPMRAKIAFVGSTHFGQNPGSTKWVGIVYDEAFGKNDGSLDGNRYFQCEPAHGSFVQPKSIIEVFDACEQASNCQQQQQQMEIEEI